MEEKCKLLSSLDSSNTMRTVKIGKLTSLRFNIMVVGETGTGKSTFLKALFRRYLNDDEIIRAGLNKKPSKTVQIEEIGRFSLPADSLDCSVHLYDSRGYGDYMNNANAIDTVRNYLERAHYNWFHLNGNMMTEADRNAADGRIHCLFYFIAPHRFKDIDGEFIKQLWDLAPIVPVIAKADTMTLDERREHLLNVHQCLKQLQKDSGSDRSINFVFEEDTDESFLDNCFEEEVSELQNNVNNNQSQHSENSNNSEVLNNSGNSEQVSVNSTDDQKQAQIDTRIIPNTTTTTAATTSAVDSIPIVSASKCDQDNHIIANTNTANNDSITAQEIEHSHMYESINNIIFTPILPKVKNIFCVVCDLSLSGKRVYPWGSLDINNEQHSDFRRLQRLIFEDCHIIKMRSNTQNLTINIITNNNKYNSSINNNSNIKYSLQIIYNIMLLLNYLFILFGWICIIIMIINIIIFNGDIFELYYYYHNIITYYIKEDNFNNKEDFVESEEPKEQYYEESEAPKEQPYEETEIDNGFFLFVWIVSLFKMFE